MTGGLGVSRPSVLPLRRLAPLGRRIDGLLPGGSLPEEAFERRHVWVLRIVWTHAFALALYVVLAYRDIGHAAFEAGPVVAFAVVASWFRLRPTLRASAATLGLLSASGSIVHLGGGLTELHFHFFVVIAIVALYHSRTAFLLAVGFVLFEHGVIGVVDPSSVYERSEAVASPWTWALVHVAYVAAMSIALAISWRFNEQAQSALERSGREDILTGVLTRAAFATEVGALLRAIPAPDVQLAVLNVDRFRLVNDAHGQDAGDAILAALALRLRGAAGDGVVGRLSGDEFGLAVPDRSTLRRPGAWAAGIVAEVLRDGLALPDGSPVVVTVSVGVVSGRVPQVDAETLIARASAALREGRRIAAGGITEHTDALELRLADERALGMDLESSNLEGQLRLHYQPIVATASGVVHSVEALVRWEHPTRGLLGPGQFLDAAREAGRLRSVEEWVIGAACAQLRAWQDAGIPTALAVNVSPQLYGDPRLVEIIRERIEASGADPAGLEIELPESLTVTDDPTIAPRLEALATLGIRLLIDDFGAGYSYLPYLSRLPLWAIKLDRGLVVQASVSDVDGAVAQAVIVMAHRLGMRVVAEGVETPAQLAWLRGHGVDDVQGYLLGRPEPIDVAEVVVRSGPVDMPAHAATPSPSVVPGSPRRRRDADAPAAPGSHVLIVEDEPLSRRLIRRHLEDDGHRCDEASDAASALAAIAAEPPDVIVLDLHLPDARPDVVFRAVRGSARTALTPIVIVSSELHDAPAGADGMLEKPVLADDLRLVVRDALAAAGRGRVNDDPPDGMRIMHAL